MLLDMATNIASASGGFFGFGNKIDKDEAHAIELIRLASEQVEPL
jgi:hypothetical protein